MTESHGYTCVIRAVGYGRLLIEEETLEPDYEGFSKVFCFFLCVFFFIIALLHSAFHINIFVTNEVVSTLSLNYAI